MLRDDVVATVLEDEAVLLDLESKYFYSVNDSGWAIVQLLEAGTTRDDILGQCRVWGAADADLEPVERFIADLVRERLAVAAAGDCAQSDAALRAWSLPSIEKHKEPLQRLMVSAFDPSLPLAE